jgi:hypothetical protein
MGFKDPHADSLESVDTPSPDQLATDRGPDKEG